MVVPLDSAQEQRFRRLMDDRPLIDLHQHPIVLTEDIEELPDYFRGNAYVWAYEAVRHGGWTAVATANILTCIARAEDASYIAFADLVDEIGLMLSDVRQQGEAVRVIRCAEDIVRAKQAGQVGFLPTVEHLAIGHDLHRVDVLYGQGIRLAGLTYTRKNYIGDGQLERTDCGLSDLGVEVVRRMNDLGMVIDLSHVGIRTSLDAIEHSRVPTTFSHNASYTLWPTARTRRDEELLACASKGGLICITAVPNSLSDDPQQDISCVLDHYDYMVKLVGVEHVGIGTDTMPGDHVGFHRKLLRRVAPAQLPAPYLDGLESPADGQNIVRGLITRGYSDADIARIMGGNVLDLLRRVMG
jgi:membrane dipeptidase